jgi:hypothetical protein
VGAAVYLKKGVGFGKSNLTLACRLKLVKGNSCNEEMTVLPEGVDLAQEKSEHDGWCEN